MRVLHVPAIRQMLFSRPQKGSPASWVSHISDSGTSPDMRTCTHYRHTHRPSAGLSSAYSDLIALTVRHMHM
eukprot:4300642-Prymnesium_polylepis.1